MPKYFVLATSLTLAIAANAQEEISPQMQAQIEALVEQKVQSTLEAQGLLGDGFQTKVEEGINLFIQKQETARRDASESEASARAQFAAPVSPENDFIRGPEDAPFSLIEYSDFECPFCKRFHETGIAFLNANTDLNWVHRHFPLEFHNPSAQKLAEASECAGDLGGSEAFWAYTDALYDRGNKYPLDKVVPLAEELGLDGEKFAECYDSGQMADRVKADMQNGQQAGVSGTPGNILRHNETGEAIVISGAQPLPALQDALNRLKARVGAE